LSTIKKHFYYEPKILTSLHFTSLSLVFLLSVLFSSCGKDAVPDLPQVPGPVGIARSAGGDGDQDGGGGEATGCNCEYQIISISASPFGNGDPNGGVEYLFQGGVPSGPFGQIGGCIGTFDDCNGNTCYQMSAAGSVSSSPCGPGFCFDPDCTDFFYDDQSQQNGSPYPTQFLPFNCPMPLYSELDVSWQPLWIDSECSSIDLLASGSTITFRVRCADSSNPPNCDHPGQGYISPPITLTKMSGVPAPSTVVELIDCGCQPVEQ